MTVKLVTLLDYTCDGCGAKAQSGIPGVAPASWETVTETIETYSGKLPVSREIAHYCPPCKADREAVRKSQEARSNQNKKAKVKR